MQGSAILTGPEATTTTGQQLADRLSLLAAAAECNLIPAYSGRRLTAHLDKVEVEVLQLRLLHELAHAIDPTGKMPRKAVSRAILAALLRANRLSREPCEYRLKIACRLLKAGFPLYCCDHLVRML